MRWEQTEFLLKGIYLGLLVLIAMRGPSWLQVAQIWMFMVGGLVLCLGVGAIRKIREGFRIRGRVVGFLLFLVLENPGMVYAGLILGMTFGTYTNLKSTDDQAQDWALLGPIVGGAVLGILFWFLRHVRQRKIRVWLGLGLAMLLVGGPVLALYLKPDLLGLHQREMLGYLLLLGIPGFYLLTFASLVEESEVEIAAMCAALGISLFLLLSPQVGTLALVLPLAIYYVYTRRVLPGLRVFKHALRGMSYAMVGQFRPALASLNRALVLDPRHTLAREQLWFVHRQMDVDQLKSDPETLALINYDLCLERAAWLLLLDKPKPAQLEEAERLLELVASQRPALEPACAYWRAVLGLHRRQYEDAARELESVLREPVAPEGQPPVDSPQRRGVLFQAWQLALVLHPEMTRRVAHPLLARPGRRMEAIAAVERRLAQKPDDNDAWDLKRILYSELTESEYNAAASTETAVEFEHAYVQQLGLALVDNPQRWERGCEYLRIAARGLAKEGPAILLQIGKIHEQHGDKAGPWHYCQLAMHAARKVGLANLKPEDAQNLFTVVKQQGDEAMAQGRIDDALEAFKFYTQYERSGLETYRTLADLFEKKGDVWMALHCTEHALSYDGADKDLLERKDRYYYSIQAPEVKARWDNIQKWFDYDYCVQKTRFLLERFNGDLDLVDWAGHLAELAQVAKPSSLTARYLRARVRRLRGEIPETTTLLEEIRQNKPEKFPSKDEEESWYAAHRLLGDMYLDEKPDQAVQCFLEFRNSERSGADTMYKLGRAYENLGDFPRAARSYEQVTAFTDHPLFYDAREGLERVKRQG